MFGVVIVVVDWKRLSFARRQNHRKHSLGRTKISSNPIDQPHRGNKSLSPG